MVSARACVGRRLRGRGARGVRARLLRAGRRRQRLELRGVPGGVRGRRVRGRALSLWITGMAGAKGGPHMLADPEVGDAYEEGLVRSIEFYDVSEVASTDVRTCVPEDCYNNVLREGDQPARRDGWHTDQVLRPHVGLVADRHIGGDAQERMTLRAGEDQRRRAGQGRPRGPGKGAGRARPGDQQPLRPHQPGEVGVARVHGRLPASARGRPRGRARLAGGCLRWSHARLRNGICRPADGQVGGARYSRIGPSLRRRWWPRDAPTQALHGKHVVVTGASGRSGSPRPRAGSVRRGGPPAQPQRRAGRARRGTARPAAAEPGSAPKSAT